MPLRSSPSGLRRSRLFTTSAFGALALAAVLAAPAHAQLVQGPTPAQSNGSAPSIDQSVPNATTVTLGGSRTVIDWDKFDINSGERADFIFANRSDIVLNRVGGAGSTINGDLGGLIGAGGPAGGNIWIYNANGVVIGANARINTGGLLVTTAAIDRADDATPGGFLDGSSTGFGFTGAATGSGITVRNGAQLNSHGGAIALVSTTVTAEAGSGIAAQDGGNVLIGSAAKYKIRFRPTSTDDLDLLSFEVASGADGAGNSAESIDLGGDISGNRVFVAAVSKTGLAASILSTGTITATNAATDESGAIILSANHNIVNSAVEAAPVSGGIGTGFVTTFGGALTAPAVTVAATEGVMLRGDVNAAGGTVDVRSDNGDIRQFSGVITAGTVSASARTGINFNSFSANRVDKLGDLSTDTGDLSYIGDEDGVELTGLISAPGKVTLGARGFIDTTTGSITAGSLELFLGGGGLFKVNGDANLGNGLSNGAVTIEATGDITLANEFNLSLGDQLTLTAGDAISETTGFVSGGGAVVAAAVNAVNLGQANQVSSFTATSSSGGDVTLRGAGTFGIVGGGTTGTLSATSDTGNITGTGIDVGRLTASAAGGNIDFSANTNAIRALGNVTGWGSVAIRTTTGLAVEGNVHGPTVELRANGGDLTQAAGSTISGHALTITASGSILQDANAVMRGTGFVSSIVQAGDDLILAGSNRLADHADVTLGWGNGSDVTYRSAYDIFFQPTGAAIGALNLIVDNGTITQGSGFTANRFSASASGDILLNNAGNNVAVIGGMSSASGGILYRDANGFDIAGNITATSGGASLRTSGAGSITQSDGIIDVDYLGVITAGSGNSVTLNQANRIHRLIATSGNGTLSINSTTGLLIDQNVYFDTISLSSGGAIAQSNTGSFGAGTVNLSAVTGINLPGASFVGNNGIQNFGTITNTTSGGINIVSYSGSHTSLTGNISAAGQTVSITDVAGYILQTGGVITADTLNLSATGGINVGGANQVSNLGAVSGAGLSFANAGSFNVTRSIDMTGAHLNLTSNSGAIIQNAGTTLTADTMALNAGTTISQATGATLHSTNLSLTSGGNTSLGEANNFITLNDLAVGGDLTLRNLGNINLSPILGGTGGYRSGGALTLVSDTGNILTTNSGIATSRLNVSAAGSISLDGTIASLGTITAGQSILLTTYNGSMELTGNVTGRSVSLYGETGLNQTGGIIDADRLNVITNGAISLTKANQIDVVGRLDTDRYDFGTGHDITLRNVGAIVLDYQIEAPDGTVTLTSDTGGISQTSFSDRFIAGTLNATAPGVIMLDQSANNVAHLGNVRSSGGAVVYVDADGFDLTGQVRAAGTLSLMSGGAISTNGGLVVAGGLLHVSATSANLVAGGNILLGTINTSGNFAIDTDQDLTVGGTINTNGNITTLNAAFGAIQHGGGRILNGSAVATSLNGINLGGDNRLTSFAGSSTGGGNIIFNNGGSGAIVVGLSTTGSATVTAGGNLSSSGITVDGLSVDAGHIDLTNSVDVNSFTRLVAAYGDVLVTKAGSFTVDGDVTTNRPGLRTIDLRANGGGITQTAGMISGHYVSLRGVGDLIQSGTARIDSNAAYFSGANVLLGGANSLVSNDTDIVATGNLTLRNAGAIDLTAVGGYTAGGVLTLTSDTGSITATDAVTASALTALAANGAITFNNTNNLISGIRGLGAGTNATVRSNGGVTLTGDIDVGGTLALYARTGINQTGGRIKATTLDAQLNQTMTTGSVLLGGANDVDNLYVLAASGGGDVLFRDTDGFRVTYAVVGNRVTLTSDAGAITQASGYMDGVQAGQLTVSAVDGISLDNDWNGIRTILGLANTGSGGIDIASRGVNMVLNGNVTAAGQAVSFNVRNASLTQTSGAIVADSLSAQAQTGIALTSTTNNVARLTGLGNTTSGGIAYTDADSFTIAGTIVAGGQAVSLRTMDANASVSQTSTNSLLTVGTLNLSGGQGYSLRGNGATRNYITALGNVDTVAQIYTDSHVDLTGTIASPYFELWARGDVTQSAGRIDNALSGNYFEIRADRIALTSSTNRLGKVDALLTWGNVPGTIAAVSTGDTKFGEIVARDASLTVTGGSIIDYGGDYLNVDTLAVSSAGTVSLGGRISALGTVTANGDTAFRSSSNLAFTDVVNVGTGRLMLRSGGAISQNGGTITAGAIDVSAATGINLGRSNNIAAITGLGTTSGDIFFRNWSGIALPSVSAPGALTLISESGSVTQNIGTTLTASRLDAEAATLIALTNANQLASLGRLAAGSLISVTNQGNLSLTGDISASSVALTSNLGSITQAGGAIATSLLDLVAGGDVVLDRANAVGVFNARSGTGGAIALRNAGDLVVNAITAQNGTVHLASNTGSVSQLLVPGNSIWAGKLNVNAATDIDLAAQNITGLLGNLAAGGSIRYNSFGTLGLDGDIRAGDGVTFGIQGFMGQYSGTIAASHLDVTATGIALIGANDIGSTIASRFSANDDITFRSVNSILLGATSTPGLLSLTSDNGDIRQSASFSAGRFDAIAAGDIVLEQLNTLDTVYDVTAGGVFSLRTVGALELDGRIAASDRVAFNTGGGLTQIGNTVIVTDRLEATAGTATTTGIRLLNHNRVGAVSLDASGNDIRFRNTGNIAINAINAPTGTVELISNLGKITQQASGGLVAGSLVLDAAGGVELYNSDNQIARLDVISRGNVSILTGGSGGGGLLTVDRIDAAGQAVSVANYIAGTTGGNITAASLTVFSAGNTDLGTTNNVAGNVALSGQNIIFTNLGNLVLDRVLSSLGNAVLRSEEGAISQTSGSALFDTTGLTAYGRDGVTLAGGIRRIDGLSAGAGAEVEIVSSRALELAGDISARNVLLRSNAAPDVLNPTGGAITQTGGVITAAALDFSAAYDVLLGGANNVDSFAGTSANGNISFRNTGSVSLGTVVLPGTFTLTSDAGAVTQTGDLTAGGLTVTARDGISLTRSGNAAGALVNLTNLGTGGVAYTDSGSILIGAISAAGQAVTLSAGGDIDEVTGIEAATLNLTASTGDVTLSHASGNLIGALGTVDVRRLTLATAGDLDLAGAIAASDALSLTAGGRLTQSGGHVATPSLSLLASGGIDLGETNQVEALTATNSGGSGDIRFVNGRSLTLGNLVSDHGDAILRLTAGQLTLGADIFSLGSTDIEAADGIGGTGAIDARQSVRVVSDGSIDLALVSGRDDILIDAGGDAAVRQLVHLSGAPDAAGNGYKIDILGNNVTLGANNPNAITAANRLYVETGPVVRLGARAGNATLNLMTMNQGVSIAAAGDVRAHAVADLSLVDILGANVGLTSEAGGISASRVDVAGDYSLTGRSFDSGALQPLGARAGTWTLTGSSGLDALGQTLEYGGNIDFTIDGAFENGSVRSLAGGVTISADALDLHQISAATGIDAQATIGDLELFSADTAAGNLDLTAAAVRVSGALAAGTDIAVSAATGDAVIGYATAGRNIGISAAGDATLRQANLTGATGDLTIGAGGNAVLGDDDALSGIGTDRWFERAAGSTGTATITGGNGAFVNLDHSAKLDDLTAARVAINVASGNLAIGQLTATTHGASVDVANGSLAVGNASAANGTLDLIANDDLTLLGGASALETYLTAGGLLDTSAASVNGTDYVELTGGAIRAGTIGSGGDIDAFSTAGAITADSVHSTGGNAIFNAFTDLGLGNVIANGGQLQAGGNAAVRAITAPDGFALVALGNVTLGADTADLVTGGNLLVTGGNGSGGATLISLGGDVSVNLQSATGVFATIASAVDGDASVHVATGNLEIGDLAGHNIAVTLPGGTLTVMNPVSSGGNYTLTARDFGGNALLPAFGGGATRLNNVSITDTDGDFGAGGSLVAAGNIRVSSVGNITGTLSLLADGDVEVTAKAIRLGNITGRDVVLGASVAGVDVVGAVTVGRGYTLTGSDFSGNALAAGGARLGDLFVTDTVGDFAYGALDLGFGGTATIRANSGAIRGGNIATLGNLSLSATGVEAGTLRSDQGGVDVDSRAGVDLAAIRASNAISVNADGNLRLGHAELTGTGINSFTLAAGGDLLFGAADAASIGSGNAFTSAGSAMAGGGLRADGGISVNLDRSARLTGIDGGILELTVRNGDLAIGDIRTVGAMFVNGPSGALTIGDAETSAGHIGIAGQGDVTTGALSGRFVVDIGSSAGSVAFRKITGGGVTLAAAGGIAAVGPDAGVFADSLTLSAGGNVDLATGGTGSRIGSLRAVTVANGDFALRNLQDLALDGAIDVRGGTLDLQVAGALSQNSGTIRAQRLVGSVSVHARLDGANSIASLGNFNSGGLLLNNMTALGVDGVVDGGAGSVTIRARGGMTIAATGAVRSASTGDAITLASDGLFRNLAGEAALGAANGRWLVYTQALGNPGAADPANDFGGLGGRSFYGAAYDFATGDFAAAPTAGNRFVYGYRPVLTVQPNDVRVTYDGQIPVPGASISGLINGDRAADAWSGNAGFSGAGRNAGVYTVAANLGSLVSDMNYDFTFGTGTLWIDPRAITATLAANGKIYDGTTGATGTLSLGGVVAGDDVAALGVLAFADKNAGLGKMVTATGITISGADAGNYVVDATAIGLADIARRSISATLAVNGKTYDGTTNATGTLSLGGIVAGDQVGVTGGIAFDSRNAGVRTATASGLSLDGADAGNYVVTGTVTDTATIARLGIIGTATADSRVYDGTVAATGRIALNGVLAGDAVSATAGYVFANPNAGAGRSVSVNGLALTGADAGNYMITLSGNPVFADILLRPMTVAADDLTKLFGQRDPALTWRIVSGSLVAGDVFTGALERAPGEQAGRYAIGRGGLALSPNYALTIVPGSLTIRLTQSGADASDALLRLRPSSAFSLDANPSAHLKGDAGEEAEARPDSE